MSLITSRAEWLASLKVGDSVGVSNGKHWRGWVGTISRFTKAGKLWIRDDRTERTCFTPDGRIYPFNDSGPMLIPPDEIVARNLTLDQRSTFEAAVVRLYNARGSASDSFDFTTHTETLRLMTQAVADRSKP